MTSSSKVLNELKVVMRRHDLEGIVVADACSGNVLYQVGSFSRQEFKYLNMAPEGHRPWIPQTPEEFVAANRDLEDAILPQMISAGNASLYLMRPVSGQFAVSGSLHVKKDVREKWAFAEAMALDVARALDRAER